MDCKEFERLIDDYINGKLNYAITKRFDEHLRTCPNCREELNIQFLIDKGLVRLEEGSAFDLQKEMQELLMDSRRKIRFHERFLKIGRILETIVMVVIIAVVAVIIIV